MSVRNYFDKVRRYFWFSLEEWKAFVIAVISMSIIYSWDQWGATRFDFISGIQNLLITIIVMSIVVFVHHAGQRLMGLVRGFRVEQTLWWYGFIIGLIFAMLSGGNIKFIATTSTFGYMLYAHRLGRFRYGPNLAEEARIALAGPVMNIFLAGLVQTLAFGGLLSQTFAHNFFVLSMWFVVWNLLPIPPLDGSRIVYSSRIFYALVVGSIIAYALLALILGVYSILLALLIGIALCIIYFFFVEGG